MRRLLVLLTLAAMPTLFIGGSPAVAATSQLTIDHNATLSPGGTLVTVTGTITCTPGDNFAIGVRVSQQQGTALNSASGTTSFGSLNPCTGTSQTWQVQASTSGNFTSGTLHPGQADAQARSCTGPSSFPTCGFFFFFNPDQIVDAVIQLH